MKNGKIDVREIVPIQEEEDSRKSRSGERDYEELRVKTLEGLNTVRNASKSLEEPVREKPPCQQGSRPTAKKIKKQIKDVDPQQVVEDGIRQSAWRFKGPDGPAREGNGE